MTSLGIQRYRLDIDTFTRYLLAPKPPRSWDGTFEATHRVKCPQPDGSGIEDCLVVNVFTPVRSTSLAVLVLVHGGNFQSGSGPTRPPTQLLKQDFVVVTFNYRISLFGFLCLGIQEAPGNAGLKDQVAALYWINRNIANFRGNPYDVTVYGVGGGAAAVQFLLLSGSTKGLIHKAILESGSALSPLSMSYDPISTAIEVAKSLGFDEAMSRLELFTFYNRLPYKKIMNISSMFLPCLEKNLPTTHSLLEKNPLDMLKTTDYEMVPMLVAYTDAAEEIIPNEKELEELLYLPGGFRHILPNNLEFDSDITKQTVADVVKNFYFSEEISKENVLKSYVNYIHDVVYEYPIVKMSMMFAATNAMPVYLMKLIVKESESDLGNTTKKKFGILDLFYNNENLNKEVEIKLAQVTTLWSNFIRIGDPTPIATFLIPVIWQPLQLTNTKTTQNEPEINLVKGLYLHKAMIMNYQLADEKIIFWEHIYRNFYKPNIGFINDSNIHL